MTIEDFTSSDASGGLRVVLLLDDLLVPAWIYEMLAEIRKIRNIEIVLVVLPSHSCDRAGAGRLAAEHGGVGGPAGIFALDA